MGRIEEALRRAGAPSLRVGPGHEELFVSPWTLGTEHAPKVIGEQAPKKHAEVRTVPAVRDAIKVAPDLHVVRSPLIDRIAPLWKERLVISLGVEPALAEQFRRLAATLLQGQHNAQLKTILITSAVPADGKTLTTLNLALILSESYRQRVLLIDADLRRPTISAALGLSGSDGLNENLKARDDRKAPVVELTDTLTLLPAGRPDADPVSGLTSGRMRGILQEAASRFDWVLIDTSPVGAAADAGLLSPMVDGALLVIRSGRTPHKMVERAIEVIGRDRILGVILNAVEDLAATEYRAYYDAYATGDK